MLVKITHPVSLDDRVLLPGETVNVPSRVGRVWIEQQRATKVVEVSNGNGSNSQ